MTDKPIQRPGAINRRIAIGGGVAVAALAAGAAYLAYPFPAPVASARAEPELAELMKTGPLPENTLGEATAPVTIIEYSSMTCPHCANFHKKVLPGLKSKYIDPGKVRYIIREFPLDNLAAAAFMLARCVGPERYFPFVDALYEKQEDWAFGEGDPVPRLFKIAQQAGFTKESFEQCLKDQKLLDGIVAVRKRGHEKFGVRSTPTFFVNGKMLKGGASIEEFEKLMPAEVKG